MTSNLAKWGSYDVEEAEKEAEELEKSGGSFFKFKVGRNVLRFLPPPLSRRSPFVIVHEHFIALPGEQNSVRIVCPRMMSKPGETKEVCRICDKADQLKNAGSKKDRDRAYELFPKRRVYAIAVDRSEPEKGPQVVSFGKKVHEALVALRKDEDAGGDYTHPMEGFDIIVERTGTGKNDTEYKVRPARKQSELGNLDWIDQQPDLERFTEPDTAESIAEKLGGKPKDEDEDAPPNRKKRTAADDLDGD